MPGPIAAIFAKWLGLSTVTKAATATATAVTTLIVAGGAVGIIPSTLASTAPEMKSKVSPSAQGAGSSSQIGATGSASSSDVDVNLSASDDFSAPAGGGAKPAAAAVGGAPNLPDVPVAGPGCVDEILAGGAGANPTATIQQVRACVDKVLGGLPQLAVDVKACVKSVLDLATSAAGGATSGGLPITSADLGKCVPLDSTRCMASALSLASSWQAAAGGGLPGTASLGGVNTVLGNCMPFDVDKCLESVLGGLPANNSVGDVGQVGALNLSACVPTGAIPQMTSIPGLSSIPGLPANPSLHSMPGLSDLLNLSGFGR